MLEINGEQLDETIIKPDCRTEDFPNGFGKEIRSRRPEPINVNEWILGDPEKIIEETRQAGIIILNNGTIEPTTSEGLKWEKLGFSPIQTLPWHSDGKNGTAVIILGRKKQETPRLLPTLAAPRSAIIKAMKKVVKTDSPWEELKKFHELADRIETRKNLEIFYKAFLRANKERKKELLKFLEVVHEKAKPCIIEHNWKKRPKDIVLIYTRHDKGAHVSSKVLHGNINYDEIQENPGDQVWRSFLVDKTWLKRRGIL